MMIAFGVWLVLTDAATADNRVALNDACVGCHPTQSEQWTGSQHATSFVDAPFQEALLREPRPFCRGCHAPEQDDRSAAISPASRMGVGCVSCHVERDRPLVFVDGHVAMDPVADCDGCHEFGFPDNDLRAHPLAMQRTLTEHRASPQAAQSCTACHMTRDAAGAHDHAFDVTRNAEFLARAIEVHAERVAADRVQVTLRVVGAGHDVPTGDLFRRLEVGAVAVDLSRPPQPVRRWLGRRFDTRIEPSGLALIHEIGDDRLPADGSPRELVLEVADAGGRDVVWWVSHQRVGFPRGSEPVGAILDGETAIAGGLLD